jgi:hypothetical protein
MTQLTGLRSLTVISVMAGSVKNWLFPYDRRFV